jgi:hypothetical protein
MKLKRFLSKYQVTADTRNAPVPAALRKRVDDEFLFCLDQLGGKTFNHGIYRVYRGDQLAAASKIVGEVFRAVQGEAIVFAYDWSGRQFAIDFTTLVDGKPTVDCFDLGCPDSFCTDLHILEFHNRALVKDADAALAEPFYNRWRKKHKDDIAPDKCVGYKVPLFVGGKDKVGNLALADMEVYPDFLAQAWNQVKDFPDGTPLGDVRFEPPE